MSEQPVQVLVVDDEAAARTRLSTLLRNRPGIEVIGECRDGVEALELLSRRHADLMTLDVQMPELDGFGVLAHLRPEATPVTIFVTAFDEHALRAFDVGAADYVLKPIQPARFDVALDRALLRVGDTGKAGAAERRVLRHVRDEGQWLERLVVERAGSLFVLPVDAVRWIEGADNYARVHASDGTHLLRITLGDLERQLDPQRFLRVHRSSLVALRRIRRMTPGRHGDALLTLDDGTRLRAARTRTTAIRERLRQPEPQRNGPDPGTDPAGPGYETARRLP